MTQTSSLQSITLPVIGMGCSGCERSMDKTADHAPPDPQPKARDR